MPKRRLICGLVGFLMVVAGAEHVIAGDEPRPAAPVVEDAWIRPSNEHPDAPVWGIRDGISIGLPPTPGPRGLFRIYAPYLGQRRPRMVNFVSIEPVVDGVRGQSELETGLRSERPGLDLLTGDTFAEALAARDATRPCRGRIVSVDGTECLTFYVATEPYRNGAGPVIQVLLRSDRPHEVGFRTFAAPSSAPMEACVLSATMGNYGRLRRLWLNDEAIDARDVWPTFEPDRLGFAPWREWPGDRLLHRDDSIVVAATTDETDLTAADYAASVPRGWRYIGRPATHYWRTCASDDLQVRVNGRKTYWGGNAPIPGGVSFENFELSAPFSEGRTFWFGVTPAGVESLGFER